MLRALFFYETSLLRLVGRPRTSHLKQHKAQLASDRYHQLPTPQLANQMRLISAHRRPTGCCSTCAPRSLRVGIRCGTPSSSTIRLRSAEDRWSHASRPLSRVRHPRLASCCPEAETFSSRRAQAATVWTMSQRGGDAPRAPDPFTPNASTASSIPIPPPTQRARNKRTRLAQNGLQTRRSRA